MDFLSPHSLVMKTRTYSALPASLLPLAVLAIPLAFTADARADGPPVWEAQPLPLTGRPLSTRASAAIEPASDAAAPKAGTSENTYDRRFVERVKGLVQMGTGLQRACAMDNGDNVNAATAALAEAIVVFLDAELTTKRADLDKIDARLKEIEAALNKPNIEQADKDRLGKEKKDLDAKRDALTKEIGKGEEQKKNAPAAAEKVKEALGGQRINDLCTDLCASTYDANHPSAASPVDVCLFGDDVTATAAIITDIRSVEGLARHLIARTDAMKRTLQNTKVKLSPGDREIRLVDLPSGPLARAVPLFTSLDGARQILEPKKSALALDVGALTLRTMDVAIAALAKVIEDRAKREGLVWFLERMHDTVCKVEKDENDERKKNAIKEISTYWLNNTCSLAAHRSEFMQYGGGADLLRAFRGAIEADVKRWPGSAAGLGAATLFLKDKTLHDKLPNPLACHADPLPDADKAICDATKALRKSTAKLTDDLMAGVNVGIALDEYSTAIDALNRNAGALFNAPMQAAACAASVPLVFHEYDEEIVQLDLNRYDATEALLLGALTRSPACFAVTGAGWKTAECKAFDPKNATSAKNVCESSDKDGKPIKPALHLAVREPDAKLERLTTILRWSSHVDGPARAVVGRWAAMRSTGELFKDAFEDLKKNPDAPPPTPPPFDVGSVNDAKTFKEAVAAVQRYVEETARIFQQSKQVKFLQTSAAFAHTAVDFGVSLTTAGKSITEPVLFPGLCPESFSDPKAKCDTPDFSGGHDALVKLSEQLGTIESALTGDFGKVVPRVIAEIRADVDAACKEDAGCKRFVGSLARYAGIFTALATDPDPEATARALDAAAMPIGGWRRKLVPDSTTISIAAFPGFAGGVEWRYGQYGATYERLGEVHPASPTLSMPVGVDFVFNGATSTERGARWMPKFFVSILDPAAYLQYDIQREGRLPGAQILTVLSPGLSIRFTPADSPFSLNIYGMFRPNLRAWESGVSVPGAHAVQAGLNLSVDVTLFELFADEPDVYIQ